MQTCTPHPTQPLLAASFLLPRGVHVPALALYAFCRLADDAVDATDESDKNGKEGVARLRERLRHVYAGTVGAMMALLTGVRSPDALARGCDLGVAMQLSDIARDVGEDARRRRLDLPRTWMLEAGLEPDAWLGKPAFSAALGPYRRARDGAGARRRPRPGGVGADAPAPRLKAAGHFAAGVMSRLTRRCVRRAPAGPAGAEPCARYRSRRTVRRPLRRGRPASPHIGFSTRRRPSLPPGTHPCRLHRMS